MDGWMQVQIIRGLLNRMGRGGLDEEGVDYSSIVN